MISNNTIILLSLIILGISFFSTHILIAYSGLSSRSLESELKEENTQIFTSNNLPEIINSLKTEENIMTSKKRFLDEENCKSYSVSGNKFDLCYKVVLQLNQKQSRFLEIIGG